MSLRILYSVRLFSGLDSSVQAGRWEPTGVPTIFKVMEALDRGPHQVQFVLSAPDGPSPWTQAQDVTLTLDGLATPVRVLSGQAAIPKAVGRLRTALRDLRQAWQVIGMARREKPDAIYLDHANVWAAGVLGRLLPGKVLFRVMGVYPVMRRALDAPSLKLRALRWCYRAPFGLVICSQDGSGVEGWLDRALRPEVPRVRVINGVDPLPEASDSVHPDLAALPQNKTIVLSVGKLEQAKGADCFIDAFLSAWAHDPNGLHALVVGTGSLDATLRQRVVDAGAEAAVTFIPRLPFAQVAEARRRSDIYVSLNRLGNLSNANLEAMLLGQCMVFPQAQPDSGIDLATDALIPADAVRRIPHAGDTQALAAVLLDLHRAPEERQRMGAAIRTAAQGFLGSWERRIGWELELINRLASGALRGVGPQAITAPHEAPEDRGEERR
jgi:glycosyltransferase involved in cell wall biosynthesis